MGKKKLQGADGMNFQLQLTIKGLESINLPEENLTNESGNDIMKISCWGGKLSAYVNLPNAIRPNNVQPFQLSDCIKIELVRNQVIEHMRSYLQKHLKDKYSDEFLSMMSVTKMECNLTIKCVGDCKPKDVIRLFERSFAKVTVYKETDPNGKTHRKPERGITTTKPHEWVLKVYDKTFQQRQAGNLKVESNLIRVELVFLDRMLDRMYSSKKSLEDILTRKAIKTLIDQYQETFDEICKKNITPMNRLTILDHICHAVHSQHLLPKRFIQRISLRHYLIFCFFRVHIDFIIPIREKLPCDPLRRTNQKNRGCHQKDHPAQT